MRLTKFMDCYFSYENNILSIGNDCMERRFHFAGGTLFSDYIINKSSGYSWRNNNKKVMAKKIFTEYIEGQTSVNHFISDNDGLSEKHLSIEVTFNNGKFILKQLFKVFPQTPFITIVAYIKGQPTISASPVACNTESFFNGIENNYVPEVDSSCITPRFDCIDCLGIENPHLKIETIKLFDRTDANDFLVEESKTPLYPARESAFDGNLFIVEDYINGEGLMLVKESPTALSAINRYDKDLFIKPGEYVQLVGTGVDYDKLSPDFYTPCYGSSIGVGSPDSLKTAYKRLYSKIYLGDITKDLFIISNTWGDRNQDKALNHDFLAQEIQTAQVLGIDIVQIDDGWQKGITANSALAKGGVWEGYYASDNNFWDVNMSKFPEGLSPLVELADSYGIKLGLWFSPDSSKDFANWERDAEILLNFYRKYKIQYFKLDGIKIRNKLCEVNLTALLSKVSKESNNEISFNMDITAETRFGYLYEKQFGTIFVENRYTDWANYYPHNTLKNLWCLTKIMPARKFLFEVLNNKRNTDKYNNILAPSNYSMDYIFATTMLANPLLWMEMSMLKNEDKEVLSKIIKVYKKYRKEIFGGEVIPIGDMPDGCSFTGFQVSVTDKCGFFLLFRENTKHNRYSYKLPSAPAGTIKYEYLYSNIEPDESNFIENSNICGEITVSLDKVRSFVFVKYQATF